MIYFLRCSTFFIHLIFCLPLFFSYTVAIRSSNEIDRLALLAFKSGIRVDPFKVMNLWNDSVRICEWYGVTCNIRHQRVTQLNLISLNLEGSISSHIGNLSFLHVLQLQNNDFVGHIPPEIGRLQRLQVLVLSNNSLDGEIPLNLGNCSELQSISLRGMNLEGEIPLTIRSLSNLRIFIVSRNNLTGSIPFFFGNFTSLEILYLGHNNFIGRIPQTLGGLVHLRALILASNMLHDQVPSSLFNLSSLEVLDVSTNQLEGRLPPDSFLTLPYINTFSFPQNYFTGPIPLSLSNASNLQLLQLNNNNFTGNVPSLERLNMLSVFLLAENQLGSGEGAQNDLTFICSMTNATALDVFQIGGNKFGGILPTCIANLSSELTIFDVGVGYISGIIPQGIGNLVGLQILVLYNNSLSGVIPESIGNPKNLGILYLGGNNLSGWIPTSLGNLTNLLKLDLTSNSLEGRIPLSLQNCTSLQLLSLDQNKLIGDIPPQVLSISSLSLLFSASQNRLSGHLPEEVGKLSSLSELDLSSNMLSGQIPTSLAKCTSLQYLYLESNKFQGAIPSFMSSMKGLQILDLSSNNLSGQIPQDLTSLDLIMLNLSFNDLEGEVPMKGVFVNASVTLLEGNNKLCGGISALHLPKCNNFVKRRKRIFSTKAKVVISTIVGLGSVALVILILYVLYRRRKRRQSGGELASAPSQNPPLQFVSYGDLHRSTNGFSQGNLVGTGGFGHVYRGVLGEGGQVVAIKVLDLKRIGASRSFIAECEALRNIRHKNLVKLITICSGVDYQGNEFKALVYEFMSNGSLEDWLHPTTTREDEVVDVEAPQRKMKLGLLKRLNIAIDVASLMEYVHHEYGTPLVHCDIKPSNILLDGNLSGHVSDFGLAKFLSDTGFIRDSAHPSSSLGIRGTVGYTPPEYGLGSEVSTQGDVYSYGIVLLEMLTGKRPTHEMFKEGLSLHLYAKMALPKGVIEILDPDLEDFFENEDQGLNPRRSMRVMDCLASMIEIGVACSLESSVERMGMREVSAKLRTIKDNLLRGRN